MYETSKYIVSLVSLTFLVACFEPSTIIQDSDDGTTTNTITIDTSKITDSMSSATENSTITNDISFNYEIATELNLLSGRPHEVYSLHCNIYENGALISSLPTGLSLTLDIPGSKRIDNGSDSWNIEPATSVLLGFYYASEFVPASIPEDVIGLVSDEERNLESFIVKISLTKDNTTEPLAEWESEVDMFDFLEEKNVNPLLVVHGLTSSPNATRVLWEKLAQKLEYSINSSFHLFDAYELETKSRNSKTVFPFGYYLLSKSEACPSPGNAACYPYITRIAPQEPFNQLNPNSDYSADYSHTDLFYLFTRQVCRATGTKYISAVSHSEGGIVIRCAATFYPSLELDVYGSISTPQQGFPDIEVQAATFGTAMLAQMDNPDIQFYIPDFMITRELQEFNAESTEFGGKSFLDHLYSDCHQFAERCVCLGGDLGSGIGDWLNRDPAKVTLAGAELNAPIYEGSHGSFDTYYSNNPGILDEGADHKSTFAYKVLAGFIKDEYEVNSPSATLSLPGTITGDTWEGSLAISGQGYVVTQIRVTDSTGSFKFYACDNPGACSLSIDWAANGLVNAHIAHYSYTEKFFIQDSNAVKF